ncbi:MAG: alpha/beta hydrolase, partial [Mucinivorans sp.]
MKRILTLTIIATLSVLGSSAQIREETVELHSGDCTLQGSLMLPSGYDYSSVALLISNSSTADRDGNERVMRNYALKMMATSLAQRGIASLRYDKRGVGASLYDSYEQNDRSLSAQANDIKNLVNSLRLDKRFAKVVVVGHGEGALLGMLAITRGAVASGFVSVEGVGRSFDQVLKDQLANQPIQMRDIAYEIIDTLKTGKQYPNVPVFLSS